MVSRPRCSTSVPSISIAFNLRLSDVAEVRRGYEDPPTLLIRHQGEPAFALGVVRRQAAREFASPKVRFAMDSPLEGSGFELSVPLLKSAAVWTRANLFRGSTSTEQRRHSQAVRILFLATGVRRRRWMWRHGHGLPTEPP